MARSVGERQIERSTVGPSAAFGQFRASVLANGLRPRSAAMLADGNRTVSLQAARSAAKGYAPVSLP